MSTALLALSAANGLFSALFVYAAVDYGMARKGFDGVLIGFAIAAFFAANAVGGAMAVLLIRETGAL